MSTPDPQHHDAEPNEGEQRRRMSTDMMVVLAVVGVLIIALMIGGFF